jgi:hypothetical protein
MKLLEESHGVFIFRLADLILNVRITIWNIHEG